MKPPEFFISELRNLPFERGVVIKGNEAWCRCPYHAGGKERTGSLRIRLQPDNYGGPGRWKCFGCDNNGDWNDLAKTLGMTKIKGFAKDRYKVTVTAEKRKELLEADDVDATAEGVPWNKEEIWREISGKLVHQLGGAMVAKEFPGSSDVETNLYLPVTMWGEKVGGVYCRIFKEENKKSYIYPGGFPIKEALFPFDWLRDHYQPEEPLWLVEGPRDALNIIQHGGFALANLGAYTAWSKAKCELIVGLNPSIVLIAFDPDTPGKKAAQLSRNFFKSRVPYKVLQFPKISWVKGKKKKMDPGELTRKQVRKIIQTFRID